MGLQTLFLCVICVCLSTFQNREVGWIHTNEGFDTTSQVRPLYLKTRAQPPKDHLPKCDGESSHNLKAESQRLCYYLRSQEINDLWFRLEHLNYLFFKFVAKIQTFFEKQK